MNYTIWDEDRQITNAEKYMLTHSLLPEYQWIEDELKPDRCDIDAYDRLSNIRNHLKEFLGTQKNNILICGKNLGCGKASWALKLMLTYFEINNQIFKGVDEEAVDRGLFDIGIFLQTTPFLVKLKQFGSNKESYALYQRLENTGLVVFDDIAAVKMSNYDYNVIYAIVEKRIFSHFPSIFTTNITDKSEMETILGPRLADRVWNNSLIVELKGNGYRGR